MIKRLFSLLLVLVMLLPTFSAFGCTKTNGNTNVIRVCNCEDYIDEGLLLEFEQETGITVEYSTYGTNENLYNELVINPNSYDLVVPSEYMIEKLAEEGRIQKLDFTKLSEYKANVSPYIQNRLDNLKFTVKNGEYVGEEVALSEFMVGYMWGTMGWVYNTEYVTKEEVSSWGGVFENPALSKKITIKDAVRDSFLVGLALVYKQDLINASDNATITEILNRTQQIDVDRVGEKLSSIKPMLYGFEVDSGKNDIVLGNINAYVAWSGDAAYAIDVAAGEVEDDDGTFIEGDAIRNLSYSIPDEGSNIWFDGFVMPSGSNNHDSVYKFLEFISRPENVYRNMNYTGYTSMVVGGDFAEPIIDEDGNTFNNLYDAVFLGWFDESEDLEVGEGKTVDFSYLFGVPANTYTVTVSEESYGRLIAQYPTEDIVARCAIMNNFDSDTLMVINDMWEKVKGETFDLWMIILIVALVVLLATLIVILRNKDKIFKTEFVAVQTKPRKKGYKVVKIEELS